MSSNKGRHRKKVKIGKKRFIAFLVIIAAVLVLFASSQLIKSNQNNLLKMQYPIKYSEYVDKYAEEYNVPKALVYAVIRTESSFCEDAGSSAGALGLMQLIPDTFEWLQLKRSVSGSYAAEDLFEPEINIDYGTYFLSYLLEKYDSEECALAAYNAGFGAVDDWLANSEYSADGVNLDYIPYDETREYVKRVSEAEEMYRELYDL